MEEVICNVTIAVIMVCSACHEMQYLWSKTISRFLFPYKLLGFQKTRVLYISNKYY